MTEDFWGQFEYEDEVENTRQNNSNENYWQQFEEVPQQNEQALENVNELPADDSYVSEKKYTEDQLARVLFTPEELRAIDSQGPMGWVEYRTRFVTPKDYVPFGMLKQGADASRLLIIAKNIENGKDVSDSDKTYMREQLRKQVELSRRGLNWGAKAASMFVQAPAFMVEFALMGGLGKAAAAGAIKAAGAAATKAAIKTGTKIASSKIGAMALGRKATEKVGTRYALSVSAEIVGKGAAYQGALVPMYAYEHYGERQIADGLKITDKGEVMFSAPKESAKNLLKAFGTAEITILSELSGGIIGESVKGIAGKVAATNIGRGISAVSAKVYNSLPKATRVKLEAVNKVMNGYGKKLKDKNIEFHGVAEEMGEERLEDVLMVAFDLDNTEGYTADQWMSAIFPEPQQLLLEAGIFSIMGSASLATRTVITDLKNKGYSEEEAKQIANNLSEIEKEHMANEILGEVKMNEDITEDEVNKEAEAIQLKLQQLQDNYIKDLSTYTNNLYRETNAEGAVELIDPSVMSDTVNSLIYLTNNKDLALGQGKNTGVILEFSSKGLQGQINTQKPTWKAEWENNNAEFIAKYNNKNIYMENIKSITIKNECSQTPHLKRLINYLNNNNWSKILLGNGDIKYIKNFSETNKNNTDTYNISTPDGNYRVTVKTSKGGKQIYERIAVDNEGNVTGKEPIVYDVEKLKNKYKTDNIEDIIKHEASSNGTYNSKDDIFDVDKSDVVIKSKEELFDVGEPGVKQINDHKLQDINVTPVKIDVEAVPKFEKISELKNWIAENLNLIGDISIKSNNRTVNFNKGNIGRSMKGINRGDVKRNIYSGLREMVENSVFSHKKDVDERHKKKSAGQEIYYSAFSYNDKSYGLEIIVDIPKNQNQKYSYAGHKIKEIKKGSAINVLSQNGISDRTEPNYSINDIKQLFNPHLKNNEETVTNEKETLTDKIIRGESTWGKFYTDFVDRLTPLENLVKKVEEKTGEKIKNENNPYFSARMYAGIVGSIKQQINDKTFVKDNGKIKITGEGFLPIINDYVDTVKSVEPNFDKAINDLSDYMIAQRYLLDLKDREGFEATEEQKLKAVEDMAKLNLKYGDKIDDISKIADRIYKFKQRILHNLVDSGNMSQEAYDKIIKENPHHISYKRVMDDNFGTAVTSKGKFTDAKSPVKKIKGSEKAIQNIFLSTLEDVANILDTAERNKIAKAIANLKDILPDYIKERKPLMEAVTATVKVVYDAKMRKQLEEAAKFFGTEVQYQKSIKGGFKGLIFGSYSDNEKIIRKRLGSQDRTLAHEVGHMLDFALGVENQISGNKKIMKEINKLAEDRFKSVIKLVDGSFETETQKSDEKYIKSNKEMIANMFDLYFTSRDYLRQTAPNTFKFIENLFTGKYQFLKEIRPSSETAVEEIEQDVWTPSKQKPYGNVITYFENGQRQFVEVTKPVMEAVEGMSGEEIDFVNKFLSGSASMLRKGATITPEFALKNFIRDNASAVIYVKNYNPFIDGVKGLFNVLGKKITGKNSIYDEWVRAGGAFSSYMELNEKSVNKALREFTKPQSRLAKIFNSVNPLNYLEKFSSIFEEATRLSMYTRAKLNGADAIQAAFEAREGTLDFARSGKRGRIWNKKLPFFNAGIQGVDKMIRAFKEHPYLSSIRAISTMTIPQILLTGYYLYAAPDDDKQEYLEIPQWQKNFFYCFKIGGHWFRIPKDFTLGFIFASVPERFMIWAHDEKLPEGKELWETVSSLFGSASPVSSFPDFLPPLFRVAVEDIANYDFFRERHIYPEYMNNLEPSQRFNKHTSETAKLLGEKLNISPAKIEHTLNGLIGSSGRYVTDAGDLMLESVKKFNEEEINEKPKELADLPLLRGFVLRDPVGYQATSTNKFFENYKEVSEAHATLNRLKKTNKDKAHEYEQKNKARLGAYNQMNKVKKEINELGKQADKIYNDKSLSGDEKLDRIKPIAKRISDKAFEANIRYEEYMKGAKE